MNRRIGGLLFQTQITMFFVNFSKSTKYFFLIVLVYFPLEEFWKHLLLKFQKKSKNMEEKSNLFFPGIFSMFWSSI